MKKFLKILLKDEKLKASLLVITFISFFFFSFFIVFKVTMYFSRDINRPVSVHMSIEDGKFINSDEHTSIKITENLLKNQSLDRIVQYAIESKSRSKRHELAMTFFFEVQFIFNIMKSFMIIITTFIGLVVAKEGWEKIDKYYLYSFFMIAGFVAFLNVVPESLNIEDNIHNNKKYTVLYENIYNNILTYLATETNSDGKVIFPDRYIHLLDREMSVNNDIAFDIEKVPVEQLDFGTKE